MWSEDEGWLLGSEYPIIDEKVSDWAKIFSSKLKKKKKKRKEKREKNGRILLMECHIFGIQHSYTIFHAFGLYIYPPLRRTYSNPS